MTAHIWQMGCEMVLTEIGEGMRGEKYQIMYPENTEDVMKRLKLNCSDIDHYLHVPVSYNACRMGLVEHLTQNLGHFT